MHIGKPQNAIELTKACRRVCPPNRAMAEKALAIKRVWQKWRYNFPKNFGQFKSSFVLLQTRSTDSMKINELTEALNF
jgi:hypothetical protein